MEQLIEIISRYNIEIIMGFSAMIFLLLILNIVSQVRISSIKKKYNRLVKGVNRDNLENMIFDHIDEAKEIREQIREIKDLYDELDSRLKLSIQNVGIIRYNAFNDMGSDLSFSIALMDDDLNGFVISSIFGRNESSTYAKPIIKGKSNYPLSVEELQALDRARKNGSYTRKTNTVS